MADPKTRRATRAAVAGLLVAAFGTQPLLAQQPAHGWLNWRGPHQAGRSDETGLPDHVEVGGENHLWSYDIAGRGTPVVADGRVYFLGYEGEGPDLQEVTTCVDEVTGEKIWEVRGSDFLSDTIYNRYAIGSPTIDPDTGNVYFLTSAGLLRCYTRDGELVWGHSMMTEFGRITFPNGRIGSPLIDEDRCIIHVINAHWGKKEGPARDRFYAFDKDTGESLWGCTPGEEPKDSSFSMPLVGWANGKRVLYAGTGCGNLVCIDSRTGDPLWRFKMSIGGVNSSALAYGDTVIALHGKENIDTSTMGRLVRIKTGAEPAPGSPDPVNLGADAELWRADLVAFTSSPVLVGDRVYATGATGDLYCVNADTGAVLWHHKLAPDQIHASPLYADGKLYVPMNNGSFHILRPSDSGPEILQTLQLEGNCLGAPAVWNGRLYVHTTARLYCFGLPARTAPVVSRLQVVPADVVLMQGRRAPFHVRGLDAVGRTVADDVEATLTGLPDGVTVADGHIQLADDAALTATVVKATAGEATGTMRLRTVSKLPLREDFEAIELTVPDADAEGGKKAFPPAPWIGIRMKWDVRTLVNADGRSSKVLAKTLDNPLFQRAMGFIGYPAMSNYTMQIDLMTDGNRRTMSDAGMVNQRYLIQLRGNYQDLEITSNVERIKQSVPYAWKPGIWYTLKSRVDVAADGSGVVRAKVWPRDEPEPEAWSIEVEHKDAHQKGAPGIYGLAPQSRFRVYVDNIVVTPND